ncbi:MAG: DUF2239 family protein [Pandoraea sp.]|nr:DUF2239 family protein [Pandoraea sp.]TAL52219.1 MAG: DUF2239 family protein [Pandoraea sp.]TAM19302.1 MAG: DUF2239 family protein [Pandoraea sp.]
MTTVSNPAIVNHYTVFDGQRRIAAGSLATAALAFKHALAQGASGPVLIYDDRTGRVIDVDTRGTDAQVAARYANGDGTAPSAEPRGRGRPRLGVVAREVTLLPRHWDWLAAQPGGASVALRKLVDQARHAHGEQDRRRAAHERAYHFMSAMAGDVPHFEEAVRALFVDDRPRFETLVAGWPEDVREYATRLAFERDDPALVPPQP